MKNNKIIRELFETKLSDFGDWNEMFCYIISNFMKLFRQYFSLRNEIR